VRELLQGAQDVEARLYAADLRGCLMRAAASKEARYRGLQGIVVRDTANTLQLVTPQDRLLVVPKKACTWEFDADRRRVVTLLGPGLAARGAGCTGVMGGGAAKKPKTLRDAIRIQSKQPR
jgi:ribonuclease P protein subunit POP4